MGSTTGAAKTIAVAKSKGKDARPASAPVKKSAPASGPSVGKMSAEAASAALNEETDHYYDGGGGTVPAVRAVALSQDGTRLVVGTQTCEILEFVLPNRVAFHSLDAAAVNPAGISAAQLVCGHFKDEVWGLAVCPVAPEGMAAGDREYVTVGDDAYLRVWSLNQHRQRCCISLPGMARACDYSPDGNYLAVGFGGRVGKASTGGVDGLVKIFRFNRTPLTGGAGKDNTLSLTQVCEIKDAKQWISCVRFSPDGCTLAVGSRDNSVYLYSVLHQYERKGKFSKHNSGINQLDFTLDGKYLQSNCR
jgi:microtubule-associated protein-like 6